MVERQHDASTTFRPAKLRHEKSTPSNRDNLSRFEKKSSPRHALLADWKLAMSGQSPFAMAQGVIMESVVRLIPLGEHRLELCFNTGDHRLFDARR
jgi:hypothetical protein